MAPSSPMATRDPTPDDRLGVALPEGDPDSDQPHNRLFTEQIPRPLFDLIVMTYRYEWRAMTSRGLPAVRLHTLLRGRRPRAPHFTAPGLPRAARALEAVVQVVPRDPPILRARRTIRRGVPGDRRRILRRAPHRG